jgi:predicted transcriptional regulator
MAMSKPIQKSRHYAGVSFEPEVSAYLDDLAGRMRMSRSWVLNTIVHEYAQFIERKNLTPLESRETIIRL